MAHNPQRGEVTVTGPGDKEFKLCLTLGAIAQIEEELGLESLVDIDKVMKKPSMKHLLIIFVALLNGGGHIEITKKDMIAWDISFKNLMNSVQEAFSAAGFTDDGDEDTDEGN